jgi:hypothetical protein
MLHLALYTCGQVDAILALLRSLRGEVKLTRENRHSPTAPTVFA